MLGRVGDGGMKPTEGTKLAVELFGRVPNSPMSWIETRRETPETPETVERCEDGRGPRTGTARGAGTVWTGTRPARSCMLSGLTALMALIAGTGLGGVGTGTGICIAGGRRGVADATSRGSSSGPARSGWKPEKPVSASGGGVGAVLGVGVVDVARNDGSEGVRGVGVVERGR